MSPLSAAVVIPTGVQTNVSSDTVLNDWGWTVSYQGLYNETVTISTMFAGIGADDYVMFAARPVGSTSFTLLAAAKFSDVTTYTPLNVTKELNGAEWYFNAKSMGFAGLGDSIDQFTADWSMGNGQHRLSWHTALDHNFNQSDAQAPNYVFYGWRAGETIGLNNSTSWERLVLHATPEDLSVSPIPEPGSTLALGFLLSAGCFLRLRRKK